MSFWLACICLVAVFAAAAYLLGVILHPERF